MTVWVVLNGEKHEGASVCGIYSTKDKAVEAALKTPYCFEGGWNWEGEDPPDLYWENGCDFLMVQEFKVE